ncbi:MAG: UvrD-helicase domain-containing protein [Flavobacteriales bacterium]|mgnify:CR=1 FL=1|nr:UvrD-helicase domain-containing protein [Flavobacteriales bacterium]
MNTEPTLKVLKASAGSGKTYALVREYLRLALGSKKTDYYRHILAITFTNAAATEMKERVLKRLSGFAGGVSHPDFDRSLFSSLVVDLKISEDELQERAALAFAHILHNYSLLGVCTIDSFTHRLIRSFARDLRLNPDFAVEINAGDFVEEVVDRCLELVGSEPQLSVYLERMVLGHFEEETSWNIRGQLAGFAKSLMQESSREPLKENEKLSLDDFSRIRKKFYSFNSIFEKKLEDRCNDALRIIDSAGLTNEDFNRGNVPNFFRKILDGKWEPPGLTISNQLSEGSFAKKSSSLESRRKLDAVFPELAKQIDEVASLLQSDERRKYELRKLILRGLYSVGLLNELQSIAQQLREEENLLLISDFQKLVSEIVVDNPAPFIYERLGERYNHILFDEFQDTSELQWANFLPLIENSLSKGKFNLLVGDAKQAIYRWRNGSVEQFINLPEIRADEARASLQPLLRASFRQEVLKENYRSATAIVEFNNTIYSTLKDGLRTFYAVYDDCFQVPQKEWQGLVRIDKSIGTRIEDRLPHTHRHILDRINDSIADGFVPGDVAILVRRKQQSTALAQFLVEQGLRVETEEGFLLRNSHAVNALLNFLRIINNPDDEASKVLLAQSLAQVFPARIHVGESLKNYASGIKKHFHFDLHSFLDEHFPESKNLLYDNRSVYDVVSKIISCLHLEVDSYVEFFLQHIHDQSTLHRKSLAQFLVWWNESSYRLFAVAASDPLAVKVMTIHKSKGLQFPVVIYPMFISKDPGTMMWVEAASVDDELKFGYVSYTPKEDTSLSPSEFEAENHRRELDDLNLMYVATTRPEKRLYIIHEKTKPEQVNELDAAMDQIFDDYNPQNESWQMGSREKNNAVSSNDRTTEFIRPSFSNRVLKVRYSALQTNNEVLIAHRHFGIVLHELIAHVKSVNHLEVVLSTISFAQHRLNEEEVGQMKSILHSIVHHQKISHWFQPGLNLKTEAELITADGRTLRPDRIVLFDNHVEVIDFKTGEPHEKHKEQVREYVQFLQEISERPCAGFLVYTYDVGDPETTGGPFIVDV